MKPFFSIILPTYNRAHFLPKAIESVLTQTFKDWELIIVDDGSTDNTKEVVANYQDSRIRYIYQKNQERSAARNNGIDQAKGNYICFLDSDDYYLQEKLKNFHDAISSSNQSDAVWYDGLISESEKGRKVVSLPQKNSDETLHEFLLFHPIGPYQVCTPINRLKKNKFNQTLRIGEDVELWLRMAEEVSFKPIKSFQTILLDHEYRSINIKNNNVAKEQMEQLKLIFKNYPKKKISQKVRRKVLSDTYFNSAKHYMMNGRKMKAIINICKAIIIDIRNQQTKHRIYCAGSIFVGKIPSEYVI